MIGKKLLRASWLLVLLSSNLAVHAQAAVVGDPVLQPGDHVRITLMGDDKNLSGEFEVGPDSTLKHPLYNQVRVGGTPVSMLKEKIAVFLQQYQRNPQLEVEALFKVNVSGEVRSPNIYFLSPETSVTEAIARAGGATDRANLDRVMLTREGRQLPLDVDETGLRSRLPTIQSGDQIHIAPRRNALSGVGSLTPLLGFAASLLSIVYVLTR